MCQNKIKSQKGMALYLAVVISSLILAIGLGLATILTFQFKLAREMAYSTFAFFAADSGIEEALMNLEAPSSPCSKDSPCFFENGASYFLKIEPSGPACPAPNFCLRSLGRYKGIQRAIEVKY